MLRKKAGQRTALVVLRMEYFGRAPQKRFFILASGIHSETFVLFGRAKRMRALTRCGRGNLLGGAPPKGVKRTHFCVPHIRSKQLQLGTWSKRSTRETLNSGSDLFYRTLTFLRTVKGKSTQTSHTFGLIFRGSVYSSSNVKQSGRKARGCSICGLTNKNGLRG